MSDELPPIPEFDPLVPLLRQVRHYLMEQQIGHADTLSKKLLERLGLPLGGFNPTLQLLQHLLNHRIALAPSLLWSETQFDPRPRFTQRVWDAFEKHNFILLMGSGSTSKCLSPNTLVRMYDGRSKPAGEIVLGDKLMGPEGMAGSPRCVLDRHDGRAQMYRITTNGAGEFECNEDHILRLRLSGCYDKPPLEGNMALRSFLEFPEASRKDIQMVVAPTASPIDLERWQALMVQTTTVSHGDCLIPEALVAEGGELARRMGLLTRRTLGGLYCWTPTMNSVRALGPACPPVAAYCNFTIRAIGEGDYAGFGVDQDHLFCLESGIVTHNSYSAAVRLFLEWIRDPGWTSVKMVGPSAEHLEANLFSHLVKMHRSSVITLPGAVQQRFIGLDPKERKSAILGTIIPAGNAGGKLRGGKPENREKPHPIHGPLSRQMILIDELNMVPSGIWSEIDNLMSTKQDDCLKIMGAFNPTGSPEDLVGQAAEPAKGWGAFDPDQDFEWMSKRGWYVVRLDAQQCENVVTGRTIFPGLQTREGFDQIIMNAGGTNTAAYWSMARGAFPQRGSSLSVIPAGYITARKAVPTWLEAPIRLCGGDLALEGDDLAALATALWGRASTLTRPDGTVHQFLNAKGLPEARRILWLESITKLPKAETLERVSQIVEFIVTNGIDPQHLMLDRSGNGQGVYDILKVQKPGVRAVAYGDSATNRKICQEDTNTAEHLYSKIYSELHYATKEFIQHEVLWFNPELPPKYETQLGDRRAMPGTKKLTIEPKKLFKNRHRESPDEGDAVTLAVHAVRVALSVVIRRLGDRKAIPESQEGFMHRTPGYVSPENIVDFIDNDPA